MSKGLDALKDLKEQFELLGIKSNPYLKTIEKELKEHEQYKAIEEEFGIDSRHMMKAMLNGYYWKDIRGNICHFPELDFIRKDTCDESPCRLNHYFWNHTGKYLEDYGKTWALTKEELE